MTKYREILREKSLGLSQQKIADGCKVSKKTVNKVLKRAAEPGTSWPLSENRTDQSLEELLFPKEKKQPDGCPTMITSIRNCSEAASQKSCCGLNI